MFLQNRALLTVLALAGFACSGAQQIPPQWNSATSYIGGGLVRGSDGNFYRATKTATNHDPTKDNHTYWELYYVRSLVTLKVAQTGARFSSLRQAWGFTSSTHIASTAGVNITITAGAGFYVENLPGTLYLDEGDGGHISIRGDVANRVTLHFPAGYVGFIIDKGHTVGSIGNLTIEGSATNSGSAIIAQDHSSFVSDHLIVQNWSTGIDLRSNSHANCDTLTVRNFGNYAVNLSYGCAAEVTSASIDGMSAGTGGYYAGDHSFINAYGAKVSNVLQSAFFANVGSTIDAGSATATGCGTGFRAVLRSTIEAGYSTASSNTTGYSAEKGGYINAIGNAVSGNTTDYNVPVNVAAGDTSYIGN